MVQRIGIVAGLLALAALLWLFLQRPAARGAGERRAEATPVERASAPAPTLTPAAAEASASGSATRVASEIVEATTPADPPAAASTHLLRVRVVDGGGRPCAGLPVRAELASEARSFTRSYRATTGAGGEAEFKALDAGAPFDAPDLGVRVTLDGLFEPPVELRFPADPWPSEALELVLPPAGALVVVVLDERGEPLASGKRDVELRLARELQAGTKIWRERAQVSAPIEAGEARFAAVGLGLACTVSYDDRPDHPPAELELDGPLRAGEELRVELRLPASEGFVALRVLAPDGSPLAAAQVEASLVRQIGGGSFSSGETHTTDGAGRLVLPVREGWSEGQVRKYTLLHRPTDGPECQGDVDLSRELAPGTSELGDVALRPRPVLVAGRVLDRDGKGVAASLTVERRYGEGENEDWAHVAWSDAGEDGRFVFYDEPPDTPLRLSIDSDEHQPIDPREFAAGTSNLEIVLTRGVGLRGSVLVPAGMSPLAIQVEARGASERDRRSTAVDASGDFELTGLAPGTYEVEFSLRPTDQLLFGVSAVQARGGEDDPRLAQVDLRAHARRVLLTVRASDGSPAAGGWVHVRNGRAWEQVAFVIEGGTAEVLVPATGSDVEISVPGHRTLFLDGLADDREVRLESAFRVRCELAPDVPLPEDGGLQLRLVPDGGEPGSSHYSLYRAHEQVGWFSTAFGDDENTFDERRALEVAVPGPGTYRVVFHLVMGSDGGGKISYSIAGEGANAVIALDERSAGAAFVLAPQRSEYADHLAGK